jgi:hypothetical protein
MKVIFLDVDGVLNSKSWNDSHQNEIQDGILIDNTKVELLSKLIESTKAIVVMHSGWRFWFDSKFQPIRKESEILFDMLIKENISIHDTTPDHRTEKIKKNKKLSLVKAGEILEWISKHENIEQWVVLEDLNLNNSEVEKHQVRTGPKIGLTLENIREAEEILMK